MPEKKDKTYPSQFDKVKEITDKLEAGIQALFESEAFKNYLKTLSKRAWIPASSLSVISLTLSNWEG